MRGYIARLNRFVSEREVWPVPTRHSSCRFPDPTPLISRPARPLGRPPLRWRCPRGGRAALPAALLVLFHAQLPRRVQRAVQRVFVGRCQPYMGDPHPSPTAMYGQKQIGALGDERRLLLERDHQVAVPLFNRSQRRKDAPTDTKIRRPHMRVLFGARKTERNPAKVVRSHREASSNCPSNSSFSQFENARNSSSRPRKSRTISLPGFDPPCSSTNRR